MRVIKFRAWDKDEERMNSGCSLYNLMTMDAISTSTIDDYIFLQYTGLKDKNGKEIYESDILQWDDLLMEVYWSDGDAAFAMKSATGGAMLNQSYCNNYELIGNIYEDSELING